MDTNEVGFYVNSRMGLCFNQATLERAVENYKKFKNSVFISYDAAKANFGLNPLKAFRLSEKAIATFTNSRGQIQLEMLQEKINSEKLSVSEFFEEIQIRT